MGSKINIALIGYGYWGPNLLRNFSKFNEIGKIFLTDLEEDRLQIAKRSYPAITVAQQAPDLINNPNIDAILIATPVGTHYELAKHAIKAGKHVLIEKPLASSVKEAERLVKMAEKTKSVVMVDHTFVYTGAVRKIKELLEKNVIGDAVYYDSIRVNLGLFQNDVNVIWDLAPHDVSIIDFLFDSKALEVTATGRHYRDSPNEAIAFISILLEGDIMAHIDVSWISPVKIRLTLIGGEEKIIVYDDTEPSEKVKIYDRSAEKVEDREALYKTWWQYRTGDVLIPNLDTSEALSVEAGHFIDCINHSKHPLTDVYAGLNVVRILETATQSCREKRTIKLK